MTHEFLSFTDECVFLFVLQKLLAKQQLQMTLLKQAVEVTQFLYVIILTSLALVSVKKRTVTTHHSFK